MAGGVLKKLESNRTLQAVQQQQGARTMLYCRLLLSPTLSPIAID